MALVDELRPGAAVALDTDSIIYYVEQHPRYLPAVEPLIELIRSGSLQAHLSIITLLEVLVLPMRNGRQDLVGTYRDVLLRSPWLTLHPVTVNIAERAAGIRRVRGSRWRIR